MFTNFSATIMIPAKASNSMFYFPQNGKDEIGKLNENGRLRHFTRPTINEIKRCPIVVKFCPTGVQALA